MMIPTLSVRGMLGMFLTLSIVMFLIMAFFTLGLQRKSLWGFPKEHIQLALVALFLSSMSLASAISSAMLQALTSNPPGPGGSTGAPPKGQLEVLQLLELQPDTGGPGPAPQPLGAGEENRLCRDGAIPVPGF